MVYIRIKKCSLRADILQCIQMLLKPVLIPGIIMY